MVKNIIMSLLRLVYNNGNRLLKKDDGITLIELIVVISVIGVLAVALGFQFQGWMGSYKVESQIKEMYVDLMNARAMAMQKNRMHFVVLGAKQYTLYEDTNPAPDGNETLETSSDSQVLQKTTDYDIVPALEAGVTQFSFDKDGLISDVSNGATIRFSSTVAPDYDCIELSPTRINMGKWNGTSCDIK
jgi:prepilin-type N-terminal cleavage/methylation domain-containing protein